MSLSVCHWKNFSHFNIPLELCNKTYLSERCLCGFSWFKISASRYPKYWINVIDKYFVLNIFICSFMWFYTHIVCKIVKHDYRVKVIKTLLQIYLISSFDIGCQLQVEISNMLLIFIQSWYIYFKILVVSSLERQHILTLCICGLSDDAVDCEAQGNSGNNFMVVQSSKAIKLKLIMVGLSCICLMSSKLLCDILKGSLLQHHEPQVAGSHSNLSDRETYLHPYSRKKTPFSTASYPTS